MQKRNQFLDIETSGEDSDRGYDSEAAEQSKGQVGKRNVSSDRASKRRKLVNNQVFNNQDRANDSDSPGETPDQIDQDAEISQSRTTSSLSSRSPSSTIDPKPRLKPLDNEVPKKNKTGIVYLSSLPPYLKPSALKTLLVQRGFSPITRVFLTPAIPPSGAAKRSNRRKMYTDGWVEFASKKTAKICAETLNATIVGGRKGGWYHDDLWNIKYLRGFKWADLMEQVQRERSEREARRRIEDSKARKEDKLFLTGIEKGKVVENIRKKRELKSSSGGGADDDTLPPLQIRRIFKQNQVREREDGDPGALGEDAKRVLSKIF